MKSIALTLGLFAAIGTGSLTAQVVDKTDITGDYSQKYLEVAITSGQKSTANAAFGDAVRGPVRDGNGKKIKFGSTASMLDYMDKLGWKFQAIIQYPSPSNTNESIYLLKRRQKKEKNKG